MHYFTKERAERLAKTEKHWTAKKSNQYDNLWMVWSNESDHYVEFDNPHFEDDAEQAGKEAYSGFKLQD